MSKSGVTYSCILKNGTTNYTLDQKLDKGGEGEVYSIISHPELVAKIFLKDKPGREEKLKALFKQSVQSRINGLVRLAMPEGLLYANGAFVGYVMPRVNTRLKLFKMWREADADRDLVFPDYGWQHAVQTAYNIAELIDYLHRNHIIVGDFNPNNFVIDPQNGGRPVLVDCDSFDIHDPDTKQHFPCEVVFMEMAAPEIQAAGRVANARFSEASDNFSLAIQMFRLLMNNQDPFGSKNIGINKPSSSAVNAGITSIMKGECVYVRYIPGKVVPQDQLPFDTLPKDIRDLFTRAFSYTEVTAIQQKTLDSRPSAEEWKNVLEKYALKGNNYVLTCGVNSRHRYSSHLQKCPWCELEKKRATLHTVTNPSGQTGNNQTVSYRNNTNSGNAAFGGYAVGFPNTPQGGQPAQGGTGSPQNANQRIFSPGQPRRDAKLYYALFIIFGIAGGFLVDEVLGNAAYYTSLDQYTLSMVVAVFGVVYGLIVAGKTKDRYINAIDSRPWLFLTLTGLFAPALMGVMAFMVFQAILSVLMILIVISCCCSLLCRH